MVRPRFLLTMLAGLLVATSLATGCGGSSSAPVRDLGDLEQVAAASKTTASARFELELEQSFGGQSFELAASGGFDTAAKRAQLTFDLSSFASLLSAFGGGNAPDEVSDPGAWQLDAIQDGTIVYVRLPLIANELPPGKTWIRGDLEQLARQTGGDLSRFGSFAATDPRRALDALEALTGALETVGREEIRGVETTRYRATIDPDELRAAVAREASGDVLGSFQQAIAQAGLASVPVEIWVDDDNLLRRFELTLALASASLFGAAETSLRMDLFDYGASLDLELPSADEVVDVAELTRTP